MTIEIGSLLFIALMTLALNLPPMIGLARTPGAFAWALGNREQMFELPGG